MRRYLLAVVGGAVLPLIAGCQGSVCTLIGASSGVNFGHIVNAFPDDATYQVRACADDVCVDWLGDPADQPLLIVGLPDLSGPTTVTATLTLTSPTDPTEVVFEDSTSVDVTTYQPNGPGCEPTVYQGNVEVTRDGDLVARPFAG